MKRMQKRAQIVKLFNFQHVNKHRKRGLTWKKKLGKMKFQKCILGWKKIYYLFLSLKHNENEISLNIFYFSEYIYIYMTLQLTIYTGQFKYSWSGAGWKSMCLIKFLNEWIWQNVEKCPYKNTNAHKFYSFVRVIDRHGQFPSAKV
jgi:hypothetical protein